MFVMTVRQDASCPPWCFLTANRQAVRTRQQAVRTRQQAVRTRRWAVRTLQQKCRRQPSGPPSASSTYDIFSQSLDDANCTLKL